MSGIFDLDRGGRGADPRVRSLNGRVAALDTRIAALEAADVALSVRRSAAQAVANNTNVTVAFDDVTQDSEGGYNTGTWTYTVAVAGLYIATTNIRWAISAAGNYRQALFRVDTTAAHGIDRRPPITGINTFNHTTIAPLRLAVGQTVRIDVQQDSGGSLNIESNTGGQSSFQLARIGP